MAESAHPSSGFATHNAIERAPTRNAIERPHPWQTDMYEDGSDEGDDDEDFEDGSSASYSDGALEVARASSPRMF